jgi:signal transduction histidine kinase/ActR/RegA family two-component response regulator
MASTNYRSVDLSKADVCPVSGLPVYQATDWHLEGLKSSYCIRFFRLGDRIIFRTTSGKANGADAERGNQCHAMVEAEVLRNAPFYVQIEDFTKLDGYSLAARRAYIRHFENRHHLRGVVFLGASNLLAISTHIVAKMFRIKYPVQVVQTYSEAVTVAMNMLSLDDTEQLGALSSDRATDDRDESSDFKNVSHSRLKTISDPEWVIEDDEYRVEFQIIDGHIMLSKSKGHYHHAHVESTIRMQQKVLKRFDPSIPDHYFIADVSEMTGVSFRVRLDYIHAMNRYYNEHPFRKLIFCGPSKLIHAAIVLGRPMAKFTVDVAKDVEEALQIVAKDAWESDPDPSGRTDLTSPVRAPLIEGYVDDVLNYLSNLSRSADSNSYHPIKHPPDHPFHKVFEVIDLIYDDIQELLDRRTKDEKERLELQKKLALAQKMEAIGLLAGGVAHDLNNVLSGMATYPELLLMGMAEDHPLRHALLTIQDAGNQAAAIVQDLLTLTRRGVYNPKVFNLNTLVQEFTHSKEYEDLTRVNPDWHMALNLESRPLPIKGSTIHVQKSLMNLVLNGAEAHNQGEPPHITISTKHEHLEKSQKGLMDIPAGEYAVLSVADQGVGIEERHLMRIFEPFYTRKEMGRSGTGLGMTVVWGTVQDHQGYIDIQSQMGMGSTIRIYFPICAEDSADVEGEKHLGNLDNYRGQRQMVLVVDDVASQREIASAILKRFNYSVTVMGRGEDAVEWLKGNHADLLLMDMEMEPGWDGRQTYEAILEFKPDQQVVIASGFSEGEKIKKIKSMGVKRILKKPYTIETLIKTIYKEIHEIKEVKRKS